MQKPTDFHDLAARLEDRFLEGGDRPWSETELDGWAHRIFAHQYGACAPYRAFCDRRGVTPETVTSWEEIPAVPATAFKHFDFVSGPEPAEVVFRTSGTTRGAERRGRHHVPRLDLYRASLREPFRRALLGDLEKAVIRGGRGAEGAQAEGVEATGTAHAPVLFLSLIPSPDAAPHSSLSFMVGSAASQMGAPVRWLVDGEGRWREGAVAECLELVDAVPDRPVLFLGTALSFVHLLDRARGVAGAAPADGGSAASPAVAPRADDGRPSLLRLAGSLPDGSRIMETGGFKGADRSVSREELYAGLEELTGIPRRRMVNEYGMTELLSQLYEPVLGEGAAAAGVHVPAPWLRVRALDPTTLRPVPEGSDGILAFFDPANLGSIAHVLTEDVGSVEGGRVRLRGRAPGAEPRGCSRAMDDLMQAAAHG